MTPRRPGVTSADRLIRRPLDFHRRLGSPIAEALEGAEEPGPTTITPIVRSARTKAPPHLAYQIFTERIDSWWPRIRTVGADSSGKVVIEPQVGGRWFTRDAKGLETLWGRVLVWAPPARVVLAWQLDADRRNDPDLTTEIEIRFDPAEDGGTVVTLEHRNLELLRRRGHRRANGSGGGSPSGADPAF